MTTAYADPEALVSTQWLEDHLDDPNLRVIEVSIDPRYHEAPRVPGAVFWNGFTTILGPDLRTRFDPRSVGELLSRSGIDNDSTVVVYSDHPALGPWVHWYLRTVGHRNTRVLDGGRRKWEAEGRPLIDTPSAVTPTTYEPGPLDPRARASLEDVQRAVDDPDTVLLDVRTPEEFEGGLFILAPPAGDERAGHIPGAIGLYYEEAMNDDGTFRSREALTELIADAGVPGESPVITYCAVGMRAAHMWFVLSVLLGRDAVANYDGSWNEWGRRTDTLIEGA